MIRVHVLAACLAVAALAAACGQKGDLRLPAAKAPSPVPGTAIAPPTAPSPK